MLGGSCLLNNKLMILLVGQVGSTKIDTTIPVMSS